jgi:hypothetical protein
MAGVLVVGGLVGCADEEPKDGAGGDADCTASVFYRDVDGDGYGDPAGPYEACEAPRDYVENADDCDDVDGSVYPGAPESCDGLDNNCDGAVDEGATGDTPWYADADGDGYGDDADVEAACTAPEGRVAEGGDCDDSDPAVSPGAEDVPRDGVDGDCSGADATTLATRPLAGDLTVSSVSAAEDFCATHDAVLGDLRITGGLRDTTALDCLVEVQGSLLVTGDSLALLELPALWWVGGDLSIVGNPVLNTVSLGALRIVDGELSLLDNAVLGPPTLPALELVGSLDSVDGAVLPALTEVVGDVALRPGLELEALAAVGGNLFVGQPDQSAVVLPALETVAGALRFSSVPGLESVDLSALRSTGSLAFELVPGDLPIALPALETVDGDLLSSGAGPSRLEAAVQQVTGELALAATETTAVSLPGLVEVGEGLVVEGEALETVDLSGLETAPGAVVDCPGCEMVELGGLTELGEDGLELRGFGEATALGLAALERSAGPVVLEGFPQLTVAELPALVSLGGPLELVGLPALERVEADALSDLQDRLEIGENPVLTEVSLASLALPGFASSLELRDNPLLDTVDLGSLGPQTGNLVVVGNGALATLDLSGLEAVGDLRIVGELTSLDLSGLERCTGEVELKPGALVSLELPALTAVGDTLTVVGAFTALDLGLLEAVGGDLSLTPDALVALDLGALESVGGALGLTLAGLESVDLGALETVGGQLYLGAGGAVSALSLPALTEVGFLVVEGTEGLVSLSAPLLTTVLADVSVATNLDLVDLDGLSALDTVGGALAIVDNAELNSVSGLSGVSSVVGDVRIQRNPALSQAAALSLVEDDIGVANIGGAVAVSDNGGP